tara:strand:+ start:2316 stop:2789 length:474 start_codon:yes stop_codon:yes gene_type:complete
MRYTQLTEQERNGVLSRHIVETTERVTSYHAVWGGTKKAAKDAVDSGDVEPDDDHRDYDTPTRAKITRTEQWIACKNYGTSTARHSKPFGTGPIRLVSWRKCLDLIQVPTRTVRLDGRWYPMMPEEQAAWIARNKGVAMCSVCEHRSTDERFVEVVA